MICPNCKKEMTPVEEFTSTISVIKDKNGQMKTWTEETRDSDGNLIQKRVDNYLYIGDCVSKITLSKYDGIDKLTDEKVVTYQTDSIIEIEKLPIIEKEL